MYDAKLDGRLYSYAFYAAAVAMFVASVLSFNAYLLALALVLLSLAALSYSSGHLLNNFILGSKGAATGLYGGFSVRERLSSAVRKNGDNYLSISSALLCKNGSEETACETVETLVSNVNFPFEFTLGIASIDKNRLLEGLETKRRLKEIEISRIDPKKCDRLNLLKRELNLIEEEINAIRANKPLAIMARIRTFCLSRSELEAARESERNIDQLTGMFSSMLGFDCEILKGEDLLKEVSYQRDIA